jgi:hypothetical protein
MDYLQLALVTVEEHQTKNVDVDDDINQGDNNSSEHKNPS